MAKYLQTEFVKYYKEKLEPFGFKKVKGRQPYFVRVVNDEILHIFTFIGTKSTEYGYKAFQLMCGVATVYRKEINFSVTPTHNSDWLVSLMTINEMKDTEFPLIDLPRELLEYYYNDENISEILEKTYEGAEIIINELDKVSNMDEVLRYVLKYDAKNIVFLSLLEDDFCDEEGLFYARKEFDYTKVDKIFEEKRQSLVNSLLSKSEKEEMLPLINAHEKRLKDARLQFLGNNDEYAKGMNLLKEHYNDNINRLIEYGLDIKRKGVELS